MKNRQIFVESLLCTISTGVLISVSACTYVDPGGRQHTLRPASTSPQPGFVVVLRFTDPDTGKQYELIDNDGDGLVDLIRRVEDNRLIQPVNPFDPLQSAENPVSGGGPVDPMPYPSSWLINLVRQGFAQNDALTAGWDQFDFGSLSAEQWLLSLGLTVAPGTQLTTDNIRFPLMEYSSGNDGYCEAVLMWSSAYDIPAISSRDLDYMIQSLPDASGSEFLAIRMQGSASDIVRAIAETGSETLTFVGGAGETWSFVRSGDDCLVSVGGTLVSTVTLD